MAPTTKETVPSSAPAQENSPTTQGAQPQAAPRTNPIGLEVPVTVHASRYSAATKGFSKPLPPVHEETRTVIVFEQGAVVRLTAGLSIRETVVLTNQQTGGDVLCRVVSVKAQPGIQNYVDLEFTQRAPGFWTKSSNVDLALRNLSPLPEAATSAVLAMALPPMPPLVEPPQQSVPAPPPSLAVEPALPAPIPVLQAAPVERPSVVTLGAQPEAAARPPAPPAPMRTAPGPVAGASAGMRQTHTSEQPVLGGGLDWTKEAPTRSNKGLIAAVAILAVGGLAGGAYLFTQRTHSEQLAPAVAATAARTPNISSTPTQSQPPRAEESASAVPEELATPPVSTASNSAPAPEEKPLDTPRPVRHEPAPADLVKPASMPPQSVRQTAPLRPAVQVGSLKAPVLKNARISGSSEPPPTFSAQTGTRDVLGAGGLSGAAGPSAPAPPVAFESPEAPVKMGGQLQMPKVISSPPPVYPELARSQGVQGIVVMDALIDATGTVAAVKVTSGPLTLRQAAMDALRRWKYQPARLNGQPTSVHISVNINFTRQ